MNVGKGREQERKLFRRIWMLFAGNTSSRCRSNRLIPAYMAAGTRFYLDPQDGRLLARLDQSTRVFRWLYSALHHWDFGWLYYRPIWDIWMLNWIAFGLVLGGSSLVMGWRLLKKTFLPKKRAIRRTSRRVVKLEPEMTAH